MNEQTPRDPQPNPVDGAANPAAHDAANDPAPRSPEAAPAAETAQVATAEPAPRGRGILRPVLIGSAAALTILAVAGVGMTIADAVGDGDDEPGASQPAAPAPTTATSPSPSGSDDAPEPSGSAEPTTSPAPQPGAVSDDADALVAAIDAAIAAAGGGDATSIELERDGWDVDVRLPDGTEVEVRVLAEGEPVVRADDDDRSSDLPLDTGRIAEIREAAIAAAGGGELRKLESDDEDGAQRFEAEVVVDGQDVDVELADDLSVISVDR